MTTHAQALAIALRALPQEPRAALHFALGVTGAETGYGDRWGIDGAGSNNWGADQTTEPVNGFPHIDHHADGTAYVGVFRKYPSPEAGFKGAAFNILKPNVLAAVTQGDGVAAVNAMHANGYFELAPVKYAAAVERNYNSFLAATGEPRLLSFQGVPAASGAGASSGSGGLAEAAVGVGLLLATAWLADNFGSTKK